MSKTCDSTISVVIPTLGCDFLHLTIEQLYRGTVRPTEVLVCMPAWRRTDSSAVCCSRLIHNRRVSTRPIRTPPCSLGMPPRSPLVSEATVLQMTALECCTRGREGNALICKDEVLAMNGRAVFNFSAVEVALQI